MTNKYDIEELIATRQYDELSDEEKKMVIHVLGSKSAYTEMREIVMSVQEEDEQELPPALQAGIMNAFELHHKDSDEKIIPISAHRKKRYRKVIIFGSIAASLLIALFLFLPEIQFDSKRHMAENKVNKKFQADSVHNTHPKSEESHTEELRKKPILKSDIRENISDSNSEYSDFNDRELNATHPASQIKEHEIERNQSFSGKENMENSQQSPVTDRKSLKLQDDESVYEIASPSPAIQEINQENVTPYSALKRKDLKDYEISVESIDTNLSLFTIQKFKADHYTSY